MLVNLIKDLHPVHERTSGGNIPKHLFTVVPKCLMFKVCEINKWRGKKNPSVGVKNDENVYALVGSALMVSGGDFLKQVKHVKTEKKNSQNCSPDCSLSLQLCVSYL